MVTKSAIFNLYCFDEPIDVVRFRKQYDLFLNSVLDEIRHTDVKCTVYIDCGYYQFHQANKISTSYHPAIHLIIMGRDIEGLKKTIEMLIRENDTFSDFSTYTLRKRVLTSRNVKLLSQASIKNRIIRKRCKKIPNVVTLTRKR